MACVMATGQVCELPSNSSHVPFCSSLAPTLSRLFSLGTQPSGNPSEATWKGAESCALGSLCGLAMASASA